MSISLCSSTFTASEEHANTVSKDQTKFFFLSFFYILFYGYAYKEKVNNFF